MKYSVNKGGWKERRRSKWKEKKWQQTKNAKIERGKISEGNRWSGVESSYWTWYLCAIEIWEWELKRVNFLSACSIIRCACIFFPHSSSSPSSVFYQIERGSICFKEFMIPCSLSYFCFFAVSVSLPTAKLATFHMPFQFTYYFHVVNWWNMVDFIQSTFIIQSVRPMIIIWLSCPNSNPKI